MPSRRVMVLDAGTSALRCFVFDENARIVVARSSAWEYSVEAEVSPLAKSFDPQAVWRTCCRLMEDALIQARASPGSIDAISVTSQRQGVVFLGQDGTEIYAGPNLDLRAVFEGGAIDDAMGDRVYQTTGRLPSFLCVPAKLRWFQLHRPDAYGRIAFVLTIADWLAWRLTGEFASEPTLASEAGMLDIRRRDWCASLMRDLGLVSYHVPLARAGELIDPICKAAESDTGLPAGTPVAMAGADTQCGLLGMGVCDEFQVGVVAGWSAAIQMVTRGPVLSPQRKTWAGCFLDDATWVLESSPGDLGNSYSWLSDTLFGQGSNAFDEMDARARAVPVGSEGVTAFLGPPRMDMTSLGLRRGGLTFPVPLTFSDISRGHLVRASLEAIACSIKANLEQIEQLAGAQASAIAVGGGMTRTPTFVKILADALGREIRVSPTPQVSALGAYLCARRALGDFASLQESAQSVRADLRSVEPDPLDSAEYQGHYVRWLQLSDELGKMTL